MKTKADYPDYGEREYVDVLGEYAERKGVTQRQVRQTKEAYKKSPAKGLQFLAACVKEGAEFGQTKTAIKKYGLKPEEGGDNE